MPLEITTLEEWNARISPCCCPMPACDAPVLVAQYKEGSSEVCGYRMSDVMSSGPKCKFMWKYFRSYSRVYTYKLRRTFGTGGTEQVDSEMTYTWTKEWHELPTPPDEEEEEEEEEDDDDGPLEPPGEEDEDDDEEDDDEEEDPEEEPPRECKVRRTIEGESDWFYKASTTTAPETDHREQHWDSEEDPLPESSGCTSTTSSGCPLMSPYIPPYTSSTDTTVLQSYTTGSGSNMLSYSILTTFSDALGLSYFVDEVATRMEHAKWLDLGSYNQVAQREIFYHECEKEVLFGDPVPDPPEMVEIEDSPQGITEWKGRYRWRIPVTHKGTYFKIEWDEVFFPKAWTDWKAIKDAHDSWEKEHDEWEDEHETWIDDHETWVTQHADWVANGSDPETEPEEPDEPVEPEEPEEEGPEPAPPTVTPKSWVWTGPGDTDDYESPTWLSPWSAEVIVPGTERGVVKILNVSFVCYEGSIFGVLPQHTGDIYPEPEEEDDEDEDDEE